MTKWESLKQGLDSTFNVYSNNLVTKNMVFPAIVLMPDNQVPNIDMSSYSNRILEYRWKLIIILRLS